MKSNAQKDAENKTAAITIGQQKTQIADLKAQQGKGATIAAASVSEGADLKQIYDAGKPIVDAISQPALGDWYLLMGAKIGPLLATDLQLQHQVGIMGPQIAGLEATNAELSASNTRMQGVIDTDTLTISAQNVTINSQAVNIASAKKDVDLALNRANIGSFAAWTLGGSTIGAIGGAFPGKDGISAAEGAGMGAAIGFVSKFVGKLTGWW